VALNALGKQGQPSLVPLLVKALEDPETNVRRSAALALGQIPFESALWQRRDVLLERIRAWTGDRTVSAEAIRNLQEYVADVERKAVEETRRLQEVEKKVVAALSLAVDHDRDRGVRHFAAIALGRLASPEAKLELVKAWRKSNSNDALRSFLTMAIGIGNYNEAAALLRKSLETKLDPSTRSATLMALGLIGDGNSGTIVSDYAMKESDPETRTFAAIAVGLMDFKPARQLMRRLLKDESQSYLRPVYGLALAMLGDYDALEILEGIAMQPEASTTTRTEATNALASIHDLQSVAILSKLLSPSANVTDLVRASAVHAMGEVAEKTVLPGLEPLARDWNYLLPFNVINDAVLR
jgi:HEAT repeat protein